MACRLRPTSAWLPMTSHYYQTGQSPPHWPTTICPSSSPSTPNCPRLMSLGETTSTSRKRTGHVMLKPVTNSLLKLAKQEPPNKPRRPSGKQRIRPVASSFRTAAFHTSNQPSRQQPNRTPMNETESAGETHDDLNKQIQRLVVEDKPTKWQSADDKCDHRTGISLLWRLAKGLSGKQPINSPNKGVRYADTKYLDPKKIVNKFVHQNITPPIRLAGDKSKNSSNGNSISFH